MTYREMRGIIGKEAMFTDEELDTLFRSMGKATLGSFIISCEVAGIELTANDVDRLISAVIG